MGDSQMLIGPGQYQGCNRMPSCNRCGDIVDNSEDSDAKEVLKFCMLHNLKPGDLESVVNNRYAEIVSYYKLKLNDTQRDMIKDLVAQMATKGKKQQ